ARKQFEEVLKYRPDDAEAGRQLRACMGGESAASQDSAGPNMGSAAASENRSAQPTALLANAKLETISTNFNAPSGLACDEQGALYVANFESNSIDRIAPNGTRNAFFSDAKRLSGPIGLAWDNAGHLFVANYNSGTIVYINKDGTFGGTVAAGLA